MLPEEDRLACVAEHKRMAGLLHDLRSTCTQSPGEMDCHACDKGKQASCKGLLYSFSLDFADLVEQHFEHEEAMMRRNLETPEDNDFFRLHQAEHARLLEEIHSTILPNAFSFGRNGRTIAAIRLIEGKITEIFDAHARQFDSHLLNDTPAGP